MMQYFNQWLIIVIINLTLILQYILSIQIGLFCQLLVTLSKLEFGVRSTAGVGGMQCVRVNLEVYGGKKIYVWKKLHLTFYARRYALTLRNKLVHYKI